MLYTATVKDRIVSIDCFDFHQGSVGRDDLQLVLDSEWDGAEFVVVTFYRGRANRGTATICGSRLWEGVPVPVPTEALEVPGELRITVVGIWPDGDRIVTCEMEDSGTVCQSGAHDIDWTVDPGEDAIEALVKMVKASASAAEQARDAAETAVGAVVDDVPRVYFTGAVPQSKAEGKVPLTMRYVSASEDFTYPVELKVQGDSSAKYPKKNYNMTVYTDESREKKKKLSFKGWGEMSKFCLKANWIDFTHARNVVNGRIWAAMSRSRSDYEAYPKNLRESPNMGVVDGFPVIVYFNGMYWGRYTWNIAKDKDMFNMDDELSTNACLVGDAANDYTLWRSKPLVVSGADWTDELHDDVPEAIRESFQSLYEFVRNSSDDEFKTGIGSRFYLSSLIDLYIFTYVALYFGGDAKSQRFDTYDGRKWLANIYDMDTTWALKWDGSGFYDVETPFPSGYSARVELGSSNVLYDRIAALFPERIKERYAELRRGILSNTSVVNEFDKFAKAFPTADLAEDFAPTTGDGKFTGMPSVSTNTVSTLRNIVVQRLAYCDKWIPLLGEATDDGVKPLYPIPSGTWANEGWEGLTLTTTNGNRVKISNGSSVPTDSIVVNLANPGVFAMHRQFEAVNNIQAELFGIGAGNKVDASLSFVSNPSKASVAMGWRKTGESVSFSEISISDASTDSSISVVTVGSASISCGFLYVGGTLNPGESVEVEVSFKVDGVRYI